MFKNPELFLRGKFGMSCVGDYEKWRIWKVKHDLRKMRVLEPHNRAWDLHHNLHKLMRDNAVGWIEQDEPMIPTVHCLSNNRYHRRMANQVRYERENAMLIKKIQQIFVGHARKGGVDNRLHPLTKCINNRGKIRQKKLLEIALSNCVKFEHINQVTCTISRDAQLDWYDEQRKHRDRIQKYPYFLESRMCAPFELIAQERAKQEPRPLCWMDIEVDGAMVGRVYFVLYADICPMTAENFRSLCAGDRGKSYQCSNMESCIPNKVWVFGGITSSIFGEPFPAENFTVKHNRAGILSMFAYGERTIQSQFMILGEPSPYLDGRHVAFGRVIKGMSFLRKIHKATTLSSWGRPRKRTLISFCGQTNLKHLKSLPQPRFIDDLREHIEANKQWQLRNPFTKLDKKYKLRKVKDWNKSESSSTFGDEDEKKKDNDDEPGYEGGEEGSGEDNGKEKKPESSNSAWSSQWSYKPPPLPDNYDEILEDEDTEDVLAEDEAGASEEESPGHKDKTGTGSSPRDASTTQKTESSHRDISSAHRSSHRNIGGTKESSHKNIGGI